MFCDVTLFLVKLSPRIRSIPKRERDYLILRHSCKFITEKLRYKRFHEVFKELQRAWQNLSMADSIRFFMYVDSVKRVPEGRFNWISSSSCALKRFSVTLTYLCQEYLPFNKWTIFSYIYIFNQSFKKKLGISRFWNQLLYHSRSIYALYEINAL